MKILGKRYTIPSEYFFSSTTYKTGYFDRCVYCHKNVENDFFEYNGEYFGSPYRCNCKDAINELEIKEKFFNDISNLYKEIDIYRINNITKYALIDKIEEAYDEENEEKLQSILD